MQIYKRIALLGAIANPNVGDEAILSANLQMIYKMYGENCKVYVFTKDSSYTALYSSESGQIIPVDYLHQITKESFYDIQQMVHKQEELLNYAPLTGVSNILYESIHNIFKEIDILHIIGGGYLNSLWPDMLYEALAAATLARKYNKKYILTGISIYSLKEEHRSLVLKLCEGAEFVDFRDDSLEDLAINDGEKYGVTLDDATFLDNYYVDIGGEKYANILIHDWIGVTEAITEKMQMILIPFMKQCIKNKVVSHFHILGFSQGDIELWKQINIPEELAEYVDYKNFITQNSIKAKHIISNAKFNIGSRFHMAVFSFSAYVPVLSIYYDEYYINKLKSVHCLYDSEWIIPIQDINDDILNEFVNSLELIHDTALKKQGDIYQRHKKKSRLISSAYGINDTDKRNLYQKLLGTFENPKISVIIPIFNMDAYLRSCLDSVLNQRLKEIEILCINDGSTDYTQIILNEYAWKDKRIKIISHTNHGVAYSRNKGIETAIGEFLYFLDPDDWLPDEMVLADMYSAAKKSGVMVCGGTFKEYATRGIITQWEGNLCKYSFEKEGIMEYADYQFDYGWVRFIYNREFILYNNLRIPPLKFFEDPVFFVKVMHQAKYFYCLKRCTYCYRTGHKTSELSYEKTLDLARGLHQNILFATEYGYDDLRNLEIARIEEDYAEMIIQHLIKTENKELRQVFEELNNLLYKDHNRIEYRMYNKIIGNKNFIIMQQNNTNNNQKQEIDNLKLELHNSKEGFYRCTTWKLGNIILYIPKKIKELFKGRK